MFNRFTLDQQLLAWCQNVDTLVQALHANTPDSVVFEQAGILDGKKIIEDYVRHGEPGLALDHLFYVIEESGIEFPAKDKNLLLRLVGDLTDRD